MGSVSEAAGDIQKAYNLTYDNSDMEQVTAMQGSIWEYSDSQPLFLLGLRKNNPTATRQALESIMRFHHMNEERSTQRRRGTVSLEDGEDASSMTESESCTVNSLTANDLGKNKLKNQHGTSTSAAEELCTNYQARSGQTRIVIKKTVELISDMSKSCELVFHAVRACARFLTYPTPSVPSDNFYFGHLKGWVWLLHKGLSHFSHEKTDGKGLDLSLKAFRKEMSLLAKEANGCVAELSRYVNDIKKLNASIRKEAKLWMKHNEIWVAQMDHFFRYKDDLKAKRRVLIDIREDRFFPTDWIFEPHPSKTKLEWDFFHFQWVDLKRNWMDCEFEIRSDYSLHWSAFSTFSPSDQTEIIVHLIQHLKALIEECHHFHKTYMRLTFDSQEVRFLKFATHEIFKLKRYQDAVGFITGITRKLFEDMAVLEKVCEEYLSYFEWVVTIIEPCYRTMNRWLADDLIPPLEFSARIRRRRRWSCQCNWIRRKKTFLEMFGEPLNVVLLRSPISIPQLERLFPPDTRLLEGIPPSALINDYGTSGGYFSSIFDAGLGREQALPIHHPLPKYKKRQEQKYNIFDIHRLIKSSVACVIIHERIDASSSDVDTEKFLAVMEEVQRFLAVFANSFTSMMSDLMNKVENLESLIYNNLPEHYESLEKIILYESSKQIESYESSGTRTFCHLLRIFQFVLCFVEKTNALEDNDSTFYASKAAYYKSYGKVQSWIYQKIAIFSMYSLPSKMDMFSSLFLESDKSDIGISIQNFLESGNQLVEICENILKNNNITAIFYVFE